MKKRIFSLLLVLCLLAGLVPMHAAAAAFSDVAPSDWFYDEVEYVRVNGLMYGTGNGRFSPKDDLTRAMFVTVLGQLAGVNTADYPGSSFSDVATGKWYSAYIQWAHQNHIAEGYEGKFDPNDPVTREQMAAFIERYLTAAGVTLPDAPDAVGAFRDAEAVSGWARGSLELMRRTAILRGDGNGNFRPRDTATRAEAAALFMSLHQALLAAAAKPEGPLPDENYIPAASEAVYDEAMHTWYANDILVLYLDPAATEAQLQTAVDAVSGKLVGKVAALSLYQVQVAARSRAELQATADDLMTQYSFVQYATYDAAAPDTSDTLAAAAPNDPWRGDVSAADWTDNTIDGSNWWIEAIEGQAAWSDNQTRDTVIVGISDSSFDIGHEDLKNRCSFPNDVLKNRNQHNPVSTGTHSAPDYHGTHVAGIIGAEPDNGKGITGTAWNVHLLLAPTYATGNTDDSLKWDTCEYANLAYLVEGGAKVVNYSQGKTNFLTEDHDAYSEEALRREGNLAAISIARLLDAGHDFVVVQSAGNGLGDTARAVDARQNGWFASITAQSATASEHVSIQDVRDRVIIVGAAELREDSTRLYQSCSFSNYGAQVSVCAPGKDIYSTTPGNTIDGFETSGGYRKESGTSMSTPIVSGVCAEVWAANPHLTGAQVKSIVCETASGHVTSNLATPSSSTYRLVNARLAVERAVAVGEGMSSISGRTVLAGTNEPLSVAVTAVSGSAVWDAVSDEMTGAFSFSLPAGTYTLTLSKPGYTIDGETAHTVTVPLAANQMFLFSEPFEFAKIPDAASISGTVVDDATGGALTGARVTVYDAGGAEAGTAITSTGGGFRIPLAAGGNYTLSVSLSGYHTKQLTNVAVSGSASAGTIRLTASTQSDFAGGDGTEENPYQIATAAQLDAIREDMSAHYVLVNDITLSGTWIAIGRDEAAGTAGLDYFSGSLDGCGYTIYGLHLEHDSFDGLVVTLSGDIRNLTLSGVSIDQAAQNIGALATQTSSSAVIENCHVSGTITLTDDHYASLQAGLGGLVGTNRGLIKSCSFSGTIQNRKSPYEGGITGTNAGTIENCTVSGSIEAYNAGGIAGKNEGIIRSCRNDAYVHGKVNASGGIVAINTGTVEFCYNTGRVRHTINFGDGFAGGIVGLNRQNGVVSDCYNIGTIEGENYAYACGVCGSSAATNGGSGGVTRRCYNAGTLKMVNGKVMRLFGIVCDSVSNTPPQNCYYLSEDGVAGEGTAVTDAQLRQQSTFVGFDFDTVWTFTGDYPYPQLRSNLQ